MQDFILNRYELRPWGPQIREDPANAPSLIGKSIVDAYFERTPSFELRLLLISDLKGPPMWGFQELTRHKEIIDQIDLDMTPEKAIETYLEWGTGWSRKDDYVRYLSQESYYFVIYEWENPPQVTLLKHNTQGSEEVAKLEAPANLVRECVDEGGRKPGVGVYALNEPLKAWLRNLLGI